MSNQVMTDDRTLVARCLNGDGDAFNALVDKYSGKAYQIAYGILANREDSEEVAQDVFIRIHRNLAGFRGEAEFSTWLYRIAVNLAKNKYRWNKVRGAKAKISLDAPLGNDGDEDRKLDPADERLPPDIKNQYNEIERNIETELARMPEHYRLPLVMHNMENMSYEDIAATLNCKLGTVKSRIARAREELRKKLNLT